jgi:hypothetical protein
MTCCALILIIGSEKNLKRWTFGRAGCPPDAPFERAIKYKYTMDNNLSPGSSETVMDLPDEVPMLGQPDLVQPEKTSKKGSH